MKVAEKSPGCRIPHTLYLLVSATKSGHGKFHLQAMHLQDPTQAQPLVVANGASHSRCEALHSEGMHEKPAQSFGRCYARQSEVQSGAGARFHAVPIKILVRACYVVFAPFLVHCLDGGLFDHCTAYLLQTHWRAFVARSQHDLVRTGGSLQSEVLSRIQLCNPRYLNHLASSCVHDLSQCCPFCCLEQKLSRSAGTHSDCK